MRETMRAYGLLRMRGDAHMSDAWHDLSRYVAASRSSAQHRDNSGAAVRMVNPIVP